MILNQMPATITLAEIAVAIGLHEAASKGDILARVHELGRNKTQPGRERTVEAFSAQVDIQPTVVRLSAGHGLTGRARMIAAMEAETPTQQKLVRLSACQHLHGRARVEAGFAENTKDPGFKFALLSAMRNIVGNGQILTLSAQQSRQRIKSFKIAPAYVI